MDNWQFMDYISPSGKNMIADWYGRLLVEEQADFDSLILNLVNSQRWQGAEFKFLKGKHAGLGELRFYSARKQHRVIGFFGPKPRQFTLLIGCTHKQQIYNPHSALNTAAKRKREVESGAAGVQAHEV